jgi:hypothetical protein
MPCTALPCLPQHIARPQLVPIVAAVSEPFPGGTLIELDAVYVLRHNKPWFAPVTWLLPDESASNVHMKIGVTPRGKVRILRLCWQLHKVTAASPCLCAAGASRLAAAVAVCCDRSS